eukprot:TRINITY_DN19687_c0_g1_i3.p1 TRINITY_DN19687_c0_g1~~TRINITY_DN19687_c0_g1_i3.p1  ORF type:complete len:110 (+),score=18.71 TRINITY_DN19687_c0_g1_i3:58-387(+)
MIPEDVKLAFYENLSLKLIEFDIPFDMIQDMCCKWYDFNHGDRVVLTDATLREISEHGDILKVKCPHWETHAFSLPEVLLLSLEEGRPELFEMLEQYNQRWIELEQAHS